MTDIQCQTSDHILTITLNRPDALNAFTVGMGDALIRAFDEASDNDAVRAVVVTGAGRAFCAGMDLRGEGNVFGLDVSQQPTLMARRVCAPSWTSAPRNSASAHRRCRASIPGGASRTERAAPASG